MQRAASTYDYNFKFSSMYCITFFLALNESIQEEMLLIFFLRRLTRGATAAGAATKVATTRRTGSWSIRLVQTSASQYPPALRSSRKRVRARQPLAAIRRKAWTVMQSLIKRHLWFPNSAALTLLKRSRPHQQYPSKSCWPTTRQPARCAAAIASCSLDRRRSPASTSRTTAAAANTMTTTLCTKSISWCRHPVWEVLSLLHKLGASTCLLVRTT